MADTEMRHRTRNCKHCETEFTYIVGPGRDRIHCGAPCRKAARRIPKSQWRECSVEGCSRKARARTSTKCNPCYRLEQKRRVGECEVHKCHRPAVRVGHGLCEVHYTRVRRTGKYDLTPRVELQHSNGYRLLKADNHPVTSASNGWAFEHRIVAYDNLGKGPHPCHWCGVSLEWKDITIDHLNEVKDDNRLANLVVACSPCNRIRGAMKPFIRRLLPERIGQLIETFGHMRAMVQSTKNGAMR